MARQGASWIKSERERVTQMGADTAGVKSMPSEKRKGGQCVSRGVNGAKRSEHLSRESTEAHRQDLAFAPDEIGSYERVSSEGVISLSVLSFYTSVVRYN